MSQQKDFMNPGMNSLPLLDISLLYGTLYVYKIIVA